MKEEIYHIIVHFVNIFLLMLIFIFVNFPSVTPPIDDPIGEVFKKSSVCFMFVLWAVNYWLQYKSKKRKWYLPVVGVVLYVVLVLVVLGFVAPLIGKLIVPDYYEVPL